MGSPGLHREHQGVPGVIIRARKSQLPSCHGGHRAAQSRPISGTGTVALSATHLSPSLQMLPKAPGAQQAHVTFASPLVKQGFGHWVGREHGPDAHLAQACLSSDGRVSPQQPVTPSLGFKYSCISWGDCRSHSPF